MKKAQVLSAIALAFALGVVAPIANVSAMTHDDAATATVNEGSATNKEVTTAVDAVSALYSTYDGMVNLYNLLQDTDITGADLATASYTAASGSVTVPKLAKYVLDDLASTPFSVAATDLDKTVDGVAKYTNMIDNVVAAAEGVDNYDVMAKLFHALEDENDEALRVAIAQINSDFNVSPAIDYDSNVTVANYATRNVTINGSSTTIENAVKAAVNATSNYAKFQTLVSDVDAAIEAGNAYSTAVQKLGDAYKATGVMTTAGLTNLATALNVDNPVVTTLQGLASTASNMNNYNAWAGSSTSVRAYVEDAKKNATSYAGAYNYGLIMNIARALKNAVPTPDKTAEQVADILVGYVPTENPGDNEGPNNTDEPGDSDNKGDDNKTDDTTPGNTGAIASANGTASSTVAVVAGIATALTAAGAGVVAYRNARREA